MRKLLVLSAALLLVLLSGCSDNTVVLNSISKEVKSEFAPDRRDKTFETKFTNEDGKWILYGSTTEAEAKDALLKRIAEENIDVLHACANKLLEKERIDRPEFEALFDKNFGEEWLLNIKNIFIQKINIFYFI